ncbi:hypothetical protein [Geodermatophilus sp. URMC 62]|uniref:hypothetical protein n=1 Tax=Geodermatophilus sp. URMC 62 TaxID=3423414 RepID=UPI00406CE93A
MARKPFTCRLGLHAWVEAHPVEERPQGPERARVCRRCGRRRGGDIGGLPPAVVS